MAIFKTVEVEIDLDEFDTEELMTELAERGAIGGSSELGSQREAMLRALWDNDEAKAIGILKQYLCDCLGRAAI